MGKKQKLLLIRRRQSFHRSRIAHTKKELELVCIVIVLKQMHFSKECGVCEAVGKLHWLAQILNIMVQFKKGVLRVKLNYYFCPCLGKLCVDTVTVEGARARLSRSDAAAICDACPDFEDGGKHDQSVNTWHYAHLK